MMRGVAVALLLAGCASVAQAPAPSAEPVIAAERAFAADAAVRGTKAAFLTWSAPHGVMVRPVEGVVNARAFVGTWPDGGSIRWWPTMAGVARSGDFGFTTGPAIYGDDAGFTHFLTVWERQPDGAWRWLIDMGARTPLKSPHGPETPVRVVPVSTAAPMAAATAFEQVRAIEAAMAAEMRTDYRAAHLRRLAPDARVFGFEPAPLEGDVLAGALRLRPTTMTLTPLGGGAARSGELAYTYGQAAWRAAEREVRGTYMRVWQRRPQGWVILVDLIAER